MIQKRKALPKVKVKPKRTSIIESSVMIQDYHTDRLNEYAKKNECTPEVAVYDLIALHRQGINIAQHISKVLGVKHEEYKSTLSKLGEHYTFIR